MPIRFEPPFQIHDIPAGYTVRDATGRTLCYVYCEDEKSRREVAKLLTREEALAFARWVCWAAERSEALKKG